MDSARDARPPSVEHRPQPHDLVAVPIDDGQPHRAVIGAVICCPARSQSASSFTVIERTGPPTSHGSTVRPVWCRQVRSPATGSSLRPGPSGETQWLCIRVAIWKKLCLR